MSKRIPLPVNEIVRLSVEEGWSQREIAEKFGVSPATVSRRLNQRPSLPCRDPARRYWNPPMLPGPMVLGR